MTKRIVFTGGGSAGHVTPNLPLLEAFRGQGWAVDYIGSAHSVEENLLSNYDIPFHSISSGKLRRYFSWANAMDPFKILLGICQAWRILHRISPDVVFSKGGFVAFPVVIAAWVHKIPIVAHESDLSPGLANKLCFPFVNKICVTFGAAAKHFKRQDKIIVTGTPIREQLFNGSKERALELCQFNKNKPCFLIIGGSQGAQSLNSCVRAAIPALTKSFQVIHLCGKDKVDTSLLNIPDYKQFEYANKELADFFAAADVVLSRSGANALYEILALGKPHILVPISLKASRGDQLQNARYFQKLGISRVIDDEALSPENLMAALNELMQNKDQISEKIQALEIQSATDRIVEIIKEQSYVQSERPA